MLLLPVPVWALVPRQSHSRLIPGVIPGPGPSMTHVWNPVPVRMFWLFDVSESKMFEHGISSSYLFELSDKYFEITYPVDISISNFCIRDILGIPSFHSATGPCRLGSIAAPSDPSRHGLLCGTLHHSDALLLGRSHRLGEAPQTRFAPPKLPQQLAHLVDRDVASLLARRVACICQPTWEPATPVLTELVWSGRSRVARRNRDIKGARPSTLVAKPR